MNLFSFKTALPVILASSVLAANLHAAPPAKPTLDPSSHAAHVAAGTMPPDAPKGDPTISQLQTKVAQLEAALAKGAPPMPAAPAGAAMTGMPAAGAAPAAGPMAGMAMPPAGPMAGMASPGMGAGTAPAPAMAGMGGGMMGMMDKMMGMMDKMMPMGGGAMPAGGAAMAPAPMAGGGMGMDMMKMEMGGMGGGAMPAAAPAAGMSGGGMGMMAMDKMEMAGMMGMGPMGGAPAGMSASALPGFPGASHLYHLGATGFFLDHKTHIALTTEQTAALNKAKEQARLAKSTADRKAAQAEQELWTLTAADQPDAATIEAKIGEIEKTHGDERLAFIRAVGEASKLLTDEQRKILTGFAAPAPAATMAAPAAAMAPMKGM
ncbi:hypothetical protein [Prosthecobacter sp.]|uniref:Spy/CpxP family protein refolding chaperone n=1 Tax=Prosthecobacter sp. TaxID=1965333 RepID=UPI002488B294|nr:hypothetical protein [Prosthecobacter sp.]MDI1314874.1 hypothetical protein [Prosthecobacter sp.]